jgi:diguanylate cyclase (GGDEF)-like protein
VLSILFTAKAAEVNGIAMVAKQSRLFILTTGFLSIAAIGFLDFLTGYELAFSLFYVLPIALLTWRIGRRVGSIASSVSALVWMGADFAAGNAYSQLFILIWNTIIRLSFFLIITLLLSALRNALEREKELARTDSLTNAINSRHFFELLKSEIDRSHRYHHAFTLAYFDLDNFKTVNDRFGHPAGDQVLRAVVRHLQTHLRKMDTIARLGGDEFALLFPETGEESACAALAKLQNGLMEEMRRNHWPITVSIGAVTCHAADSTPDELLTIADHLMYSVKQAGKNGIKYSTVEGKSL